MVLASKKKFFIIAGLTILPLVMAEVALISSRASIKPTIASAYHFDLDENNSPELTDGEGTWTEERRNVTWEYHNASDNPNGHITLNHQGYFGVSSTTINGLTGVENVTATFSGGENSELWLLKSADGSDWHETVKLTSGNTIIECVGWRYVRFYYHDGNATATPLNISSVSIGYSCEGTSFSEDIDCAKLENVKNPSSTLTASTETEEISPLGNSTQALRFVKDAGAGSTQTDLLLDQTYTLGQIASRKVEFDLYHKGNNHRPSVQLLYIDPADPTKVTTVGASIQRENGKDQYMIYGTDDENWSHIEVYVNVLAHTICLNRDKPRNKNAKINAIRMNVGNCILDNVRIGSNHTEKVGYFNNGFSFKVGEDYWIKICWVGELHSVTMTFTGDGVAHQCTEPNGYFYVHGDSTGTIVVKITIVAGYDRHILHYTSKTLTITES